MHDLSHISRNKRCVWATVYGHVPHVQRDMSQWQMASISWTPHKWCFAWFYHPTSLILRSLLADWTRNIGFNPQNENCMSVEDRAALNLEFSVIKELLIRSIHKKRKWVQSNVLCFQTNNIFSDSFSFHLFFFKEKHSISLNNEWKIRFSYFLLTNSEQAWISERTCASFLKAQENMSVKFLLILWNSLPLYLFHFTMQRGIIKKN